jgi:hypothetical protein
MHIRRAIEADIPLMVAIAETKRVEYEGYSPVFWRKAPDASSKHDWWSSVRSATSLNVPCSRGQGVP